MSDTQRLFFALWPDHNTRKALTPLLSLQDVCGGRPHPGSNLHITLAFLGAVAGATRDCLELAAGGITSPPFELLLDRFGYWPRPRVMWLGCTETPSPLLGLVGQLNRVMVQCGLEAEGRPYQAHLTLLRKARQAPAVPPPEIRWEVTEFVLAESKRTPEGVKYSVLRSWPLCG